MSTLLIVPPVLIILTLLCIFFYASRSIGDQGSFEKGVDELCDDVSKQHVRAYNELPEVSNADQLIRETHGTVEEPASEIPLPVQQPVSTLDLHEGDSGASSEGHGHTDPLPGCVVEPEANVGDKASEPASVIDDTTTTDSGDITKQTT